MAGRKRGDGLAAGERVDVGVGQVGAVVDRGGAELDRELHAGPGAELVAVDAEAEPGGAARLEHGARLVGVERAVLAEDVDPASERRARGEHVAADERDVVVGRLVVRGHDVGAEEGHVVGQLGGDLAAAALGLDVEPVAGLDLEVGDAGAARLRLARGGERRELASEAARVASVGDADAAGGVGRARHPRGELVAAVAREHEVRVGVDEARDHAPARRRRSARRPRRPHARRRRRAVLDDERGVADEAERALAERLVVGDEQADVVDDRGGHRSRRRRAGRLATSKPSVAAVADDPCAADHHVVDVGRRGRVDRARARARGRARRAGRSRATSVVRSASAPGSRRPPSGQPSAA